MFVWLEEKIYMVWFVKKLSLGLCVWLGFPIQDFGLTFRYFCDWILNREVKIGRFRFILSFGVEVRRRRRCRRRRWPTTTVFSGGFWPWVGSEVAERREALIDERDLSLANELSLSLKRSSYTVATTVLMEAKWPVQAGPYGSADESIEGILGSTRLTGSSFPFSFFVFLEY